MKNEKWKNEKYKLQSRVIFIDKIVTCISHFSLFNYWGSGKRGSNSWPAAWEAAALPTELLPQTFKWKKWKVKNEKWKYWLPFLISLLAIYANLYFMIFHFSFYHLFEPITRLELVTHALRMRCSTNWAISAWFP